jgi:hypothetical protein
MSETEADKKKRYLHYVMTMSIGHCLKIFIKEGSPTEGVMDLYSNLYKELRNAVGVERMRRADKIRETLNEIAGAYIDIVECPLDVTEDAPENN